MDETQAEVLRLRALLAAIASHPSGEDTWMEGGEDPMSRECPACEHMKELAAQQPDPTTSPYYDSQWGMRYCWDGTAWRQERSVRAGTIWDDRVWRPVKAD